MSWVTTIKLLGRITKPPVMKCTAVPVCIHGTWIMALFMRCSVEGFDDLVVKKATTDLWRSKRPKVVSFVNFFLLHCLPLKSTRIEKRSASIVRKEAIHTYFIVEVRRKESWIPKSIVLAVSVFFLTDVDQQCLRVFSSAPAKNICKLRFPID